MPFICPTVTAYSSEEYQEQIDRVKAFAKRLHIDLMDGRFVETTSPSLNDSWWPEGVSADVHMMYQQPADCLPKLIERKPDLVIIHFEAEVDHVQFANELQQAGIKAGLALLHDTPLSAAQHCLVHFDHALVFSGHLGFHGGEADLKLLAKVREIRQQFPEIEVGWDGGVNDQNASVLIDAGVDVLNVGSFIHQAVSPQEAYAKLDAEV